MLSFDEIKKYNPYHDSHGRFSSASGAVSFSAYQTGRNKVSVHSDAVIIGDMSDSVQPIFSNKLDENGVPKGQITGKDIHEEFVFDPEARFESGRKKLITDQISETQGFKGKPTVVTVEEFENAKNRSGIVAFRTFSEDTDVVTGKKMNEKDFAENLMYGEASEFALNGNGKRSSGGGIYTTSKNDVFDESDARDASVRFGRSSKPAVISMTVSPTARIEDYNKVMKSFFSESEEIRNKYIHNGHHSTLDAITAYATACGYDGLRQKHKIAECDFVIIMNRTVLIINEMIEDVHGNEWK